MLKQGKIIAEAEKLAIFLGENVEGVFNRDLFHSCSEMRLFRRLRRGQTEGAGIAVDTSRRSFP